MKAKAWQVMALIAFGFLTGYLFRSKYAVHHHPPYMSRVVVTTYSDLKGKETWNEK